MMKHIEGTKMDYDIFDNEKGRGVQIIERGSFNFIKHIITHFIDMEKFIQLSKANEPRVKKQVLVNTLKLTTKGTKDRVLQKVIMETYGYTSIEIKCVEREIDEA